MIEDHQAVVKTDMTFGQFKIVDGAPRKFRFDKVFQVVTPITKAATEWEWQIHFVEQFVARHQAIENAPRVAELDVASFAGHQFTTRAKRTKRQKWSDGDERIPRLRRIEERAAQ